MPISMLLPGDSPRLQGQDAAHIARLAEVDTALPPIIVERSTMRVIDGTHRLMAAVLKGRDSIEVEFFDGDAADAFLQAVQANVAHGLPLTQADRRAAAARIIASHPHLSDRAIAEVAGLSAKIIASIRRTSGEGAGQVARVGRDGRVRPLNAVEGRLRAAKLLTRYPMASLREVAREAGISPATASDVRRRLERGEGPAPTRSLEAAAARLAEATGAADDEPRQADATAQARPGTAEASAARPKRQVDLDPEALLDKLLRDPSLRHKEEGRSLLRLLRYNAIGLDQWGDLQKAVPAHCSALVVELARCYAELWQNFARVLSES